jgi:hypothetical protein
MVRTARDVINELRKGLEDDEKNYRMARKLVDSPDAAIKFLDGLRMKMLPLMTYDPDTQPAHSAVSVVSCLKERLGGVFQDLQFIADYEERQKEYKAHVKAHAGIDEETGTTSEGSQE